MTRCITILTLLGCVAAVPAQARPQDVAPASPNIAPIQVQVVISRFRDDKKVASLPYSLSLRVNDMSGARLQVGGNVPVPTADGKTNYRNIGTSIAVTARTMEDGRYDLNVNVSESAVAGEGMQPLAVTPGVAPVLRTYTSNTALAMRDGETAQFTAATDPISGELVRVDVTLRVVK